MNWTPRDWMLVLGCKSAREKVASFLTILMRRDLAHNGRTPTGRAEMALPLTREAMADYLDLTLETVSHQMSALKRKGVIEILENRRIILPDFAVLVAQSGDISGGAHCSDASRLSH